jgi:amidase
MPSLPEYDQLDGIALADLIRQRQISASEALDACLERIAERNGPLNAIARLMEGEARQQLQGALPDGPLAGVPIVIKDLLADIAGVPTASGSRLFAGIVPQQDSTLIARYRQAGLIFAAKTTTPEFGLMPVSEAKLYGPTRNPWDLNRTPGGSSGGSGAAVASRMVAIGHGGDGGGSIRIPASNCGLFGLKPSRGRTPFGPLLSEGWQGMVEQHAVTRSVRDSAAMLDILCGQLEAGDAYHCPVPEQSFLFSLASNSQPGQPGPRLRIAYCEQPFTGGPTDPECRQAMLHTAQLLQQLGHHVELKQPPLGDPEQMCRAMLVMVTGEMAGMLRHLPALIGRAVRHDDIEVNSWVLARYGELLSAGEHAWMRGFLLEQGRIMAQFHQTYDVLLTPTLNQLPLTLGALASKPVEDWIASNFIGKLGWDWLLKLSPMVADHARRTMHYMGWTIPFNMTGQPAASVPLYWSAGNVPLGTQLVGRYGEDATLLRLAAELEQAQPWAARVPQATPQQTLQPTP